MAEDKPAPWGRAVAKSPRFWLQTVLAIGVAAFYAYHFAQVYRYAVNVPYYDEWDCFPQRDWWSWIWVPHNEHVILTTKVLIMLLWWQGGWNHITHQVVNFLIFGVLLVSLGIFLRKTNPKLPLEVIFLMLLWMLSPRMFQNHSWGFQSQWHFMALFLLGAIYFLLKVRDGRQTAADLAIGIICSALCAYSLSTGVLAVLVLAMCYTVLKIQRIRRADFRRREIAQVVWVGLALVGILVGYVLLIEARQGTPEHTSPSSPQFWAFYAALAGTALCFELRGGGMVAAGVVCLLLYSIPWGILWFSGAKQKSTWGAWPIWTGQLALLAVFGAIALGRTRLGLNQAAASRYTEFTMLMLPLSVSTWWVVTEFKRPWGFTGLCVIGLLFGSGFVNSLSAFKIYPYLYERRLLGQARLREAYATGTDAICPELYPRPLKEERLKLAESLNLSFVEELKSGRQ